jgi:uncharacterized protein (TIGR00369 family)
VLSVSEVQALLESAFPSSANLPIVESVSDQSVSVRLAVSGLMGRPGGTVSGPSMMMLADTAAYVAIFSQRGAVLLAVTTSLHIDFLNKPEIADIVAEATILKMGSRLAVVDVAIRSASSDLLVAKAQVTYSLPPR